MEQTGTERGVQVVYFSHGGGPLPILGDASHRAMVDFMTRLPAQLARPEAIIVISAHWEGGAATLLGAPNPPMFYDYYGFPEEAYDIAYPAPGHPAFAERIAGLLESDGIPARIDTRRGFDHGLIGYNSMVGRPDAGRFPTNGSNASSCGSKRSSAKTRPLGH